MKKEEQNSNNTEKPKLGISDVINCFEDEVEIKSLYKIPSLMKYEKWTKVSRFLAYGLQGVEIRELK